MPGIFQDNNREKTRIFAFGQERNCSSAGLTYSCQGTVLFRPLDRFTTCLPAIRFMPGRYPALTRFHLSQNKSDGALSLHLICPPQVLCLRCWTQQMCLTCWRPTPFPGVELPTLTQSLSPLGWEPTRAQGEATLLATRSATSSGCCTTQRPPAATPTPLFPTASAIWSSHLGQQPSRDIGPSSRESIE